MLKLADMYERCESSSRINWSTKNNMPCSIVWRVSDSIQFHLTRRRSFANLRTKVFYVRMASKQRHQSHWCWAKINDICGHLWTQRNAWRMRPWDCPHNTINPPKKQLSTGDKKDQKKDQKGWKALENIGKTCGKRHENTRHWKLSALEKRCQLEVAIGGSSEGRDLELI